MSDIPDFFYPPIVLHPKAGDEFEVATLSTTAWDENGNNVHIRLAANLPDDPDGRTKALAALRMSAWQAVWLAAQGKTGEMAA